MRLNITPVAKPRMTRADKWKKRPSVEKYRAFADELRFILPRSFDFNGASIEFVIPMPKSWTLKKRAEMDGEPHTQTPDIDNLMKALFDAHMSDDSGIHTIGRLHKRWGTNGMIIVGGTAVD